MLDFSTCHKSEYYNSNNFKDSFNYNMPFRLGYIRLELIMVYFEEVLRNYYPALPVFPPHLITFVIGLFTTSLATKRAMQDFVANAFMISCPRETDE